MSTDTVHPEGSGLSITREQSAFTDIQRAAMAHIGVQDAPDADLQVFLHQCQRTGLDPYARQIYMICRKESTKDASGDWVKRDKWTIQTGIDGFRLIGHRSARQQGVTVGLKAVEFADENGRWLPVWSKRWGWPVAARVVVVRDGQDFPGLALFDEYVPVGDNGMPNPPKMWRDRPAGQLAKCAEALAWRTAFPQDLSGMYVTEELENGRDLDEPRVVSSRVSDAIRASTKSVEATKQSADEVAVGGALLTSGQRKEIATAWAAAMDGLDPRHGEGLEFLQGVTGNDAVTRVQDLTMGEADALLTGLVLRLAELSEDVEDGEVVE